MVGITPTPGETKKISTVTTGGARGWVGLKDRAWWLFAAALGTLYYLHNLKSDFKSNTPFLRK